MKGIENRLIKWEMDGVKKDLSERWWFREYIAITLRRTEWHFSILNFHSLPDSWPQWDKKELRYYYKKYSIGIHLFFKQFLKSFGMGI